jgi:UDP-N-acetylglucosamine acyltransferase
MISNLAYVHPDAKIGENVTIEPFAYVAADVEIGDGTWVGPSAVIHDGARIGKNCKIHSFASIACKPQDLKFAGEVTTAVIGDNCDVRECVTISRGTASTGTTIIGSNNLIMAYAHVGHDSVIGNNCVIVNGVSIAGEVHVGDWVVIGGHSAIHQWIHIGDHAMIQGMSGVTKDIPPYITASNDDHYAGINRTGPSRRGFTHEQIMAIHDVCRILFQSDLNYLNACDKAEAELPQSPERDYLIDFVRSSKRGCIKPYVTKNSAE